MKIRELRIKNFGKFTDKNIRLKDGINILYGENESGKSTIHNFIKGMLFGMERGRGRASVYDTFSIYEPWENPNYYSGALCFESGHKQFWIDRNFDRYSKKAELFCEDDQEQLSVSDGDLDMLLGGLSAAGYENSVSVGQLKVKTAQSLAGELKNYATNYYAAGTSEIDLEGALETLKSKKKVLDREMKNVLLKKQQKRESIEQEMSYVWRDIHRLEEEQESLTEELEHRKQKKDQDEVKNKGMVDELRPAKWRVHPVEILIFIAAIIASFVLIPKPWNYLVAIIIFLASVLYTWNRMKVGKKQEKTPPEIILEEITPEEEKISLEKLNWEKNRVAEELWEKNIQYGNLKEQVEELDEADFDYQEYDRKLMAVQLAFDRLNELSATFQNQLKEELNKIVSQIMHDITDGKYAKLLVDEGLHIRLLAEEKWIPMERVSTGTLEQIYFALRMAVSGLLYEEEYPVILDDTFAYYDDKRLRNTLLWLGKHKKQVIIFTCQNREEGILIKEGIPYHKETL